MVIDTVILAAGKGSRMVSKLPKVMHTLAGIPLLQHVFNTAAQLDNNRIHIVYSSDQVRDAFSHLHGVNWVLQDQQLGTGHAVKQVLPHCKTDRLLVLYGDVPLIRAQTLQQFIKKTSPDSLGILLAQTKNPAGLGRIVRDKQGNIIRIVEERDATPQEKSIKEINTGILLCPLNLLKNGLPLLKSHNQQQEYYLTDIVAFAVEQGIKIADFCIPAMNEVQGINDLAQLAQAERYYQQQKARELALAGVKIIDHQRFDVRGEVTIEPDVVIDINVVLEGIVSIKRDSIIGANCTLKNCEIGAGVTILPNTLIDGARIADGCQVGPFARIRPDTVLRENAKVGNFVEIKKTEMGVGSKANHLTYLGDSTIGDAVNIGAGTITCNYDGVNKSKTVIKNGAFIGSNTALVAPVVVGEASTVGAGSTITHDVPDGHLGISRVKQKNFEGWRKK